MTHTISRHRFVFAFSCVLALIAQVASRQVASGDEPVIASSASNPEDRSSGPAGLGALARMFQQVAGSGLSLKGLIKPDTLGLEAHDNEMEVSLFSGNDATISFNLLSDVHIHVHVHVGTPADLSGEEDHQDHADAASKTTKAHRKSGKRATSKQTNAKQKRKRSKAADEEQGK